MKPGTPNSETIYTGHAIEQTLKELTDKGLRLMKKSLFKNWYTVSCGRQEWHCLCDTR